MPILDISRISKTYGKLKALDELSLTINAGEVYGLLGPNGSGKTTTLGIILGILNGYTGSFNWFEGQYGEEHRKHIGAVLETPNFYPYLNADQNLAIVAKIKNSTHQDFEEILQLVGLLERRTSKFSTYSLGMKQRLAIGATLIGNPEVLIFDEPTNGLDPQGIAEVRNVITKLASTGKTIIMASHILDEVEKICSHVAILKKGKLLAAGPVGTILSNDKFAELSAKDLAEMIDFIESQPWIKVVKQNLLFVECQIDQDLEAADVNKRFFEAGIILSHLLVRHRKLEEEFISLTSKN